MVRPCNPVRLQGGPGFGVDDSMSAAVRVREKRSDWPKTGIVKTRRRPCGAISVLRGMATPLLRFDAWNDRIGVLSFMLVAAVQEFRIKA